MPTFQLKTAAERGTETFLWLLNKWKTLDQNPNLLASLSCCPAPKGSWPRPWPCHTHRTHTIRLGWCQQVASTRVIPTDQEFKNAGLLLGVRKTPANKT